MKFDYEYRSLKIRTDHGIVIEGQFDDDFIDTVTIDGEDETFSLYDATHGVFFSIDNKMVSLQEIINTMQAKYPEIKAEADQEERDEQDTIEDLRAGHRYL